MDDMKMTMILINNTNNKIARLNKFNVILITLFDMKF